MYRTREDGSSKKSAAASSMGAVAGLRYGLSTLKSDEAAAGLKRRAAPTVVSRVSRKRIVHEAGLAAMVSKRDIGVNIYVKFKQGDLVFGLAKPQAVVRHKLEKDGYTHTFANSLNGSVVEMIVAGVTDKAAIAALDETQLKHYNFLVKHRDYLLRKPGKTIPLKLDEPVVGAAYRRACKLLLINRAVGRTSYAHFVVDEIDWDRAVHKEKSKLGVTDSEIRAAYRDFRRHGKNPFILFYNKDLKLLEDPPWVHPEVREHFYHYDIARLVKHKV